MWLVRNEKTTAGKADSLSQRRVAYKDRGWGSESRRYSTEGSPSGSVAGDSHRITALGKYPSR